MVSPKNHKKLFDLLPIINALNTDAHSVVDIEIKDITLDSRLVTPGCLFVALDGGQVDGHNYIKDAIQKGAEVVLGTQKIEGLTVPYFQVEDSRLALAQLSAAFHDHPAHQMTMIGITGTDGKTTTTNLIFHILKESGLIAGMISTVNAVIGDVTIDTGFHVTTPEAPVVQELLAKMLNQGTTHVVLEATSHGLDQKRVAECEFDIAVVTNITHEHLDYHGNYENYFNSKAQLIRELKKTEKKSTGNPQLAILNKDDISYPLFEKLLSEKDLADIHQFSYGLSNEADYFAANIAMTAKGLTFEIHHGNKKWNMESPMLGLYNVANILAAFTTTVGGIGIDPKVAQKAIAGMPSVAGRAEMIDMGQNFSAMVDFAHTPNALKVALESARQLCTGKVFAVFGSAGLRDRAKRRMMAEVSIQMADVTILTAEDPRTERLKDILDEMADAACQKGGVNGQNFFVIADRGNAIRKAVRMAGKNDLVIACGKGHEQSMCFGTTEYPWDDRTAMKAALAESLNKKGPQMPYLPTQSENNL